MTSDEIQYTKDWWTTLVRNPERLSVWLQKLQQTELGGYTDHIEFLKKYTVDSRAHAIITNIANDELSHSAMLVDILNDRGVGVSATPMPSGYWDSMLVEVTTPEEYYAANFFGESLAADRFEIIGSMDVTPSDIRQFIQAALPEEIFHRETLGRLAGEDALRKFFKLHMSALQRLMKK